MKCEEITATDVGELVGLLHGLADPTNPSACRGHSIDKDRPLRPTLDRSVDPSMSYAERLDEERCLIEKFRRRAKNLLGEWEWKLASQGGHDNFTQTLMVMQHFGAPTRLLDWTKSPFAAAFFAVVDNLDQDGAVWWFRITPYETAADEQWNRFGMREHLEMQIDYNKFAFREDSPPFLGTLYLRIPFQRLEAQQGLFTVAGRLGLLHDDLLCDLLHGQNFGKIVIPWKVKRDALAALKAMNVTAKSLEHIGADRLGLRMAWDRANSGEATTSSAHAPRPESPGRSGA